MAKQSSTKAPERPGSTSAPAGETLASAGAVAKSMLVERLRVQNAAAALRQQVSLPQPEGTEQAFYPEHRTPSPQYAQVHKRLCLTMDLPCLVCGVRNSTLANPAENRYGARQLETHHHVIEWALADAVDITRFNKTIRPHLQARQKDQPVYQRDMSAQEIHDWVDHSEDNQWVLCDVHHRHKDLGIHQISYPIWCPQDLLRPDFAEYVEQQTLSPAAPATPPAAPRPAAQSKSKSPAKRKPR